MNIAVLAGGVLRIGLWRILRMQDRMTSGEQTAAMRYSLNWDGCVQDAQTSDCGRTESGDSGSDGANGRTTVVGVTSLI